MCEYVMAAVETRRELQNPRGSHGLTNSQLWCQEANVGLRLYVAKGLVI